MLSKVIGIISYFPDDEPKRTHRIEKLKKLISSCDKFFSLPIIIIAQNWPEDLFADRQDITLYKYDKPLYITGARKELRKKFLDLDYDYLIMLDDDSELVGTEADKYLAFIDRHPDCWISINYTKSLLKLFAISKTIFRQVDFDDNTIELGGAVEDKELHAKLIYNFKSAGREFPKLDFKDISLPTDDPDSTWQWRFDANLKQQVYQSTLEIIDRYNSNRDIVKNILKNLRNNKE